MEIEYTQIIQQRQKAKKQFMVIDVFAEWCSPCKKLAPLFDELACQPNKYVKFFKVDVDKDEDTMLELEIEKLPTILIYQLYADQKPKLLVKQIATQIGDIEALIKQHCQPQ